MHITIYKPLSNGVRVNVIYGTGLTRASDRSSPCIAPGHARCQMAHSLAPLRHLHHQSHSYWPRLLSTAELHGTERTGNRETGRKGKRGRERKEGKEGGSKGKWESGDDGREEGSEVNKEEASTVAKAQIEYQIITKARWCQTRARTWSQ